MKVIAPVLLPPVDGVKVTLTVQLAPGARLVGQLLVWPKSPLAIRLEITKTPAPGLVTVTVWAALATPTAWLPKDRLPGAALNAGSAPIPLKVITRGLPLALSVMVTVPERPPVAAGVKVMKIAQLVPPIEKLAQLLVWAKSPLAAQSNSKRTLAAADM